MLRVLTSASAPCVLGPFTYECTPYVLRVTTSASAPCVLGPFTYECPLNSSSTLYTLPHSSSTLSTFPHSSSTLSTFSLILPCTCPNTLVLGHFSECYIGIIFSGTNFVVFFKSRFSEKIFSSWPLACHKIILPVWMLRMLRT